jgi:hypothetical protein
LQRKRVEKLNGNETFGKKNKVSSLLSGLFSSPEPNRKYSDVREEDKGRCIQWGCGIAVGSDHCLALRNAI